MSFLRGYRPRHGKPSKAAPVLAIGGMTAAFAVVDAGATLSAASAATSSDFARLRMCESGGNYHINTGNGFYGAYQFDIGTWRGLGYSGLPSNAGPATQDAAARRLQASRGWSPWPACSRRLGLGTSTSQEAPARASRTRTVASRPAGVPAFSGHVLSVADVHTKRADVVIWQRRLAVRGWDIAVDGHFGPQSAHVAARFAAEKRIPVAHRGTVSAAVWSAAWTRPID